MKKWRLLRLLLRPSIFSGFVVLLATGFIFAFSAYDFYKRYPGVNDYVESIKTLSRSIGQDSSAGDAVKDSVLASPVLNQAMFIGFWVIVGLITYCVFFGVYYWVKDTRARMHAQNFGSMPPEGKMRQVFGVINALMLRLLIAVAWVVYSVIYVQFLVPASIVGFAGRDSIAWSEDWPYIAVGLGLLLLGTHLLVVFLRLLLLRPRVFGGTDEFLLATLDDK